jgi:hypothetical protein
MATKGGVCIKEREFGGMVQQLSDLKETTTRIESKIDKFIESADNKYALKSELTEIKNKGWDVKKIIIIAGLSIFGSIITALIIKGVL